MTNTLVIAGDFNHSFDDKSNTVQSIISLSNESVVILPSRRVDILPPAVPERDAIGQLSGKRTLSLNDPVSDHNVFTTTVGNIRVTTWNANSKLGTARGISHLYHPLRMRKLEAVKELMNMSDIIVLSEWGNIRYNRDPTEMFKKEYGFKAFQKIGVPMTNFVQYSKGNADDAEWIMFTGTAGKVVIVRIELFGGKPIPRPINMNEPIMKTLMNTLRTKRDGQPYSIFTNMIQIPLSSSNSLYVMAVHDTADGAYRGRNYAPNRWRDRLNYMKRWFSYIG